MKVLLRFAALLVLFSGSLTAQEDLQDWYHKDASEGYMGVSIHKTYEKILKNKTTEPVVVAIIDSGVDIEHEDLKDVIWTNEDEIPNNGKDDDMNGYIDDVHGWNFIGGPNGKNVGPDTYEVTRLYGKYKEKFEDADPVKLNKEDRKMYDKWLTWKEEVESKRNSAKQNLMEVNGVEATILSALEAINTALEANDSPITLENIEAIDSDEQMVMIGKKVASQFLEPGKKYEYEEIESMVKEAIDGDRKRFEDQLEYAYNPDFNPRATIVMDDYSDSSESIYGNNDVEGPDALHGTHVAGIVAATRNNGIGMDGVANNVKIMSVRTVPDGDERDKDVANAIRYAVDNGASVINMSFGKGYAWDKQVVDDAVRYAEEHDVLLVHAAGNSAQDNDATDNFPNDKYKDPKGFLFWKKKEAKNWIEVGALSYKPGEDSPATFSNYGAKNVDVFAPGVQIYATTPDDNYRYLRGTSMASPVVAGVASVIRAHFPSLTASQVKDIIMQSATPLDFDVKKPGSDEVVPFNELSKTGGVVNLYNAVLLAAKTEGKKKIKKSRKSTSA